MCLCSSEQHPAALNNTGCLLRRYGVRAQDRNKPILFSMARLDRVKNLTGLAEMYAKNDRLRAACNLVIVGGIVDPSQVRLPLHSMTSSEPLELCCACRLVVSSRRRGTLRRFPLPVQAPSKHCAVATDYL